MLHTVIKTFILLLFCGGLFGQFSSALPGVVEGAASGGGPAAIENVWFLDVNYTSVSSYDDTVGSPKVFDYLENANTDYDNASDSAIYDTSGTITAGFKIVTNRTTNDIDYGSGSAGTVTNTTFTNIYYPFPWFSLNNGHRWTESDTITITMTGLPANKDYRLLIPFTGYTSPDSCAVEWNGVQQNIGVPDATNNTTNDPPDAAIARGTSDGSGQIELIFHHNSNSGIVSGFGGDLRVPLIRLEQWSDTPP